MSVSYFFYLLHQPLYQVAFFVGITLLLVPLLRAKNANAAWNTAGLMYIGFIAMNGILLWSEQEIWTYFFISAGASVLYLLVIGVLMPLLIRLLKIGGSGESAMIFLLIIYHPFILLAVIFLRWIVRSL